MSDPRRSNDARPGDEPSSNFDTQELRVIKVPPPAPTDPPSDPDRSGVPRPGDGPSSNFDTGVLRPIYAPPPAPVNQPSASEGYELEGGPLPADDELPQPVPVPIPSRPASAPRPKPKLEFERPDPEGSSEFENEDSEVDPVWTRWAEWGPDLIRVGTAGMATLILLWFFGFSSFSSFFFLMLFGGAATVALSYPILVTLERPVRITPEQAVEDFYAAASHHFPHFRRMWLLLSVQGRESGRFEGFEQFRDQWKGRVEGWKQTKAVGKFTPLKFEVENFQAAKSTGKETARASYTIGVYVRGRESEGPIESFRMAHGLVRGPDRMWYLNRGVLENR